MTWFTKKTTRSHRSVADIVSGLTEIVAELDRSIVGNEAEKEVCNCDRLAEVERHNIAISNLDSRSTNMDAELKQAETVKGNLTTLLGLT